MLTLLLSFLSLISFAESQTPAEQIHQFVKAQEIFVPYYFEGEIRPAETNRLYVSQSSVFLNEKAIGNHITDVDVQAALTPLQDPILLFVSLSTPLNFFLQILEHTQDHAIYLAVQEPCGIAAALPLKDIFGTSPPEHQIFIGPNQIEFCQKGEQLRHFNDCNQATGSAHLCDSLRQSFISSLPLSKLPQNSVVELQVNHKYAQNYTLQTLLQTIWYTQSTQPTKLNIRAVAHSSCQP